MALGDISNPMIADVAGALSFRQAQLEKEEQKRNEIRIKQLISQAIPDLPEDSPVRELMMRDPVRGAAVAHSLDIPLNRGDQMTKFSNDVKTASQIAHADPMEAHRYIGSLIPEYQKAGMSTKKLEEFYNGVNDAVANNDDGKIHTFFNSLYVMNDALNPSKPDYELMKIKNEQARLAQEDKFDYADLSIEQQKLELEKQKSKQGETPAVTYQTDDNGNIVALPTHLPAGASPTAQIVTDTTGSPVKGKSQPLTESQANAALFAARAKESQNIINQIGADYNVTGLNAKRSVDWIPGVGTIANSMLSNNQQSVEQAQRDFINAVLRKESGASISPQEFANAQKQYFPQPGDSDVVIKQKNANRNTAITGLEVASGGGAKIIENKQGITDQSRKQSAADRLKALTGGK